MMDTIANLNQSYLSYLTDKEERTFKQLELLNQFLIDNNCTFSGRPMPLLLKPNFLSQKQIQSVSYTVERISSVLNKFIHLYLHDATVRNIMKFSEKENELFSFEPGYNIPLVISRLDGFLHDYSIKFIEFNCDSPAGTAYSDIMENGFQKLFEEYPFLHRWEIESMNRQQLLLEALLTCYFEFRSNSKTFPEKPVIAIVDWDDVSTTSEFLIIKDYFEKKGYKTIIGNPEGFMISRGKTLLNGEEVQLVYKRVITRELIQRWDEVGEFIRCIKEGLVCCCNSFRSYIVGNKKALSLITDSQFQDIYTRDELKVIRETIPWTKILSDTTVKYGKKIVKLRDFIVGNKNLLVLKPANLYGGKDVFLGPETDQETWEMIMNKHLYDESWIVQQYVDIPQDLYPVVKKGVKLELKKVNINPFALLGKYSGCITRVSDSSVINVSAGGGLVPTMRAKRIK